MIRFETLRIALGGLLANRLRSGLTILGLTIGVASVIILIAVGNGSAQTVQKRIESLGTNVLLVTRSFTLGGSRVSNAATTPLTQQDVDALNDRSQRARRGERLAGGQRQQRDAGQQRRQLLAGQLRGHHALLPDRPRLQHRRGSRFTAQDVTQRRRALVIGPTVVDQPVRRPGSRRPDRAGRTASTSRSPA